MLNCEWYFLYAKIAWLYRVLEDLGWTPGENMANHLHNPRNPRLAAEHSRFNTKSTY